eukprot:UN15156
MVFLLYQAIAHPVFYCSDNNLFLCEDTIDVGSIGTVNLLFYNILKWTLHDYRSPDSKSIRVPYTTHEIPKLPLYQRRTGILIAQFDEDYPDNVNSWQDIVPESTRLRWLFPLKDTAEFYKSPEQGMYILP